MYLPKAEWTITGVVTEKRVMKSQKNADWQQPIVKVQTMGDTFELQCDDTLFGKIAEGEFLRIHGDFERRPGRERGTVLNFVAREVTQPTVTGDNTSKPADTSKTKGVA